MITDASNTPQMIAGNALRNFTPTREAISAPVHAPVPGSGIPTNSKSPQNSYFSIWSLFFIALASIRSTKGFKCFVPFIQLKIGVISNRINGIGIRFPICLLYTSDAADD